MKCMRFRSHSDSHTFYHSIPTYYTSCGSGTCFFCWAAYQHDQTPPRFRILANTEFCTFYDTGRNRVWSLQKPSDAWDHGSFRREDIVSDAYLIGVGDSGPPSTRLTSNVTRRDSRTGYEIQLGHAQQYERIIRNSASVGRYESVPARRDPQPGIFEAKIGCEIQSTNSVRSQNGEVTKRLQVESMRERNGAADIL